MVVLGVETSCDETSCAVVEDGVKILSNIVASQIDIHKDYYGVVPELASRAHLENIYPVFEKSIKEAKIKKPDLIAFTAGPGLIGSLLIGEMFAKTLAYIYELPLVGVNHLEGHIFSIFLTYPELSPPFIALIVSGGHTELILVKDLGDYKILGTTRDDAAGEAFDKVAKLLRLGYPGGPVIDELARSEVDSVNFPRPFLWGCWDFSFSGLKTAVLYYTRDKEIKKNDIVSIAKGFQQAVVEVLTEKLLKCAAEYKINRVVIVGGVSANSGLREYAKKQAYERSIEIFFPDKSLSTDNAAMIASVAYFQYKNNVKKYVTKSDPNLLLYNWY